MNAGGILTRESMSNKKQVLAAKKLSHVLDYLAEIDEWDAYAETYPLWRDSKLETLKSCPAVYELALNWL